jgi:hypothetical protein
MTPSKLFVNFVAELGGGGEDAHDRKERSIGRLSVGVRKKKSLISHVVLIFLCLMIQGTTRDWTTTNIGFAQRC